jgi:Na+-driven multidrug efflux pump
MESQTTDRAQLMGEQNTLRLLLKFSIPSVVGMMVQALYNFVDRIYIGRAVGSVGIAATTVSMPIMLLGFAFALMIGIGATALISIRQYFTFHISNVLEQPRVIACCPK